MTVFPSFQLYVKHQVVRIVLIPQMLHVKTLMFAFKTLSTVAHIAKSHISVLQNYTGLKITLCLVG